MIYCAVQGLKSGHSIFDKAARERLNLGLEILNDWDYYVD